MNVRAVFRRCLAFLDVALVFIVGAIEVTCSAEQGILSVADIVDAALKLALLFGGQFIPGIDLFFLVADEVAATCAKFSLTILRISSDVVAIIVMGSIHRKRLLFLPREYHQWMASVVQCNGANGVP